MNFSKIKTLLLYAQYTDKLSYFDDWRDAFMSFSEFDVTGVNICKEKHLKYIKKYIADFEFIVLLHSTTGDTLKYIYPIKNILTGRRGKLLVFVGNEVNLLFVSMKNKIQFIKDIQADFIGTQLPLEAGKCLYKDCEKSKVVELPHALNPKVFYPVLSREKRSIDIGTRAYKYDSYLGDNDRNTILNFFSVHTFTPPLVIDVNTTSRLNRKDWAMFLNNCKATISTEAGSYYLERDDKTVNAIAEYIREKRKKSGTKIVHLNYGIQKVYDIIPKFLRQWAKSMFYPIANRIFNIKYFTDIGDISFEEIYENFFSNYPKPKVYTKAISSRHFDAIGTKTCQIMFKGRFNDILQANRHYLVLERDFSNINEVVKRFRDVDYRKVMVERTFEYVMSEHTYLNRLMTIRKLLD